MENRYLPTKIGTTFENGCLFLTLNKSNTHCPHEPQWATVDTSHRTILMPYLRIELRTLILIAVIFFRLLVQGQ